MKKRIAKSIEASSEESNGLPNEPNKNWGIFVRKEYNNDKEEMNQSKILKRKRNFESIAIIIWCFY